MMSCFDAVLVGKTKDETLSRSSLLPVAFIVTAWAVSLCLPNATANEGKSVITASASTSALRSQLMAITPPGTPVIEVSAFVAKEIRAHGETKRSALEESAKVRNGPALIPKRNTGVRGWRYAPVGVKHITVIFKSPSMGFVLLIPVATKNAVEVSYAFDIDGRLLDIGVAKWVEGLP
jgi:hypothetical protein